MGIGPDENVAPNRRRLPHKQTTRCQNNTACQVGVAKMAVQTALIAGSTSFYSNFYFMQTLAEPTVTVRQPGIGGGLPAGWY
jgi:hypothetical protein